jgi:nucleoside-diphosphate-sugar epimerase
VDIDERWAAWRTTYGYVDDVAHALALCATHPQAAGVYNVGAAEAPDHAHWAERYAAVMNWVGAIRSLAPEETEPRARARYDALDLTIPLVTDTGKIRAELGFREPTDGTDALARTVADETRRLAA